MAASSRCTSGQHDDCLFATGMCECPCHDETLMPRPSLEGIEADCRKRMAAIAGFQVRGFDSAKVRAKHIAELDDQLDLYNTVKETFGDD